ncbi:helix-turn-helix transcriptional regulator [Saccharothrix xinjiangensis]|uniref:Helix-turn-helix domain-containing protein n=1 Tax=Saccharothrix xinjiangensis TaxID=204798 RepID=A0ABV9Y743_9PSEU
MYEDDSKSIGRRVREIRSWRSLTVTEAAELAGMTTAYLSMIERGRRPVTKRSVLENLARALRVSPAELTGKPYTPSDAPSAEARAGMPAVEDMLTGWQVGEVPSALGRPWGEVRADVKRLNLVLRPKAEYAEQASLLPVLIRDLLAASAVAEHRKDALIGLMSAYKAAAYLAHDLGVAGLPVLAAERMRRVAEELEDPVWVSYSAYQRAQLLSGANRARQYELAVQVADMTDSRAEVRGLAHLTAALASAALGNGESAQDHLTEATQLANALDEDVSPWMQTNFGRTNVDIWKVSIGLELGQGGRVAEIAEGVNPAGVSASRQAAFWIDYGRSLLGERRTQGSGLEALLVAERLAPQKVRNNFFAREAVSNLLVKARRDAGSRELRGLAYRMRVAPIG